MNAYLSIFQARFRTLLQYRAAAWAGFGTQAFFGLVRIMIFAAFFASSTKAQPMNFEQVVTYIWLGQALLLLIPFREDTEISHLIRSGNIAYELVRPVRLYWFWFARQFANRTAPVILRSIPLLILAVWLLPIAGVDEWALQGPVSFGAGFCFLVSLLAAVILAGSFSVLMAITLFWTISADGIANLFPVLLWSLSGIVLPLPFFPDWVQPALRMLPFRGLMDTPFQFYIGNILPQQAAWEIGHQCVWIAVLGLFGYALLKRGLQRVVIQGG